MLQSLICLLGPGAEALEVEVKDHQERSPSTPIALAPSKDHPRLLTSQEKKAGSLTV